MKVIQAPRASAILYNLIVSQSNRGPWILPANICPVVPVTFFKAGIPVEFVDISAETLHMDLEQAEARLKRGAYGGVLYAHTYGEASTPDVFFQSIKSSHPNLTVVDDRCLCNPDLEPNPDIVADVALYSTGYAKIAELGVGGYAFLKDSIAYQAQQLPFQQGAYEELEIGYKQAIHDHSLYEYQDSDWLQTDSDQPAWYDYRLQIEANLKKSLQQRITLNEIYANCLPNEIQLQKEYQTWRFNIRVKNKQHIFDMIFASGLFASSHYASLAGIMASGACPQAEKLANGIINLFNDQHFDTQKAEQVCAVIMENLS